jgi:hypothetical protein
MGLLLVGVEGFRLTSLGGIQPCQEYSNDIADTDVSLENFVDSTKCLIRGQIGTDICFEIVFEGGTL